MVNTTYLTRLAGICNHGDHVVCRTHPTIELLGQQTTVDMASPLVTLSARNVGYRFACAEAAWILSGDNRLATIVPFAKDFARFSDDGVYLAGAYGPTYVDQLPYVLKALEEDSHSRQAVMTIWRKRPMASRDMPCTVSLQFMIRENALHCFANMRSSDAWLGVPYDWFSFSMMAAGVALRLRAMDYVYANLSLGNMYFTAASSHLYTQKTSFGYDETDVERLMLRAGEGDFEYAPLSLDDVQSYDLLVSHLWCLAKREPSTCSWLRELSTFKRKL